MVKVAVWFEVAIWAAENFVRAWTVSWLGGQVIQLIGAAGMGI
jgi:hypothetical protein